jgi:hypothetical protein
MDTAISSVVACVEGSATCRVVERYCHRLEEGNEVPRNLAGHDRIIRIAERNNILYYYEKLG